jgi:hypothetical protein
MYKCYNFSQSAIVIIFMLSFYVIIFDCQQMLSFLCYHFPWYIFCVIIYVIIWCYHLFTTDMITFADFYKKSTMKNDNILYTYILTYVEYRAVSDVFQNIDPPPPLHLASVSSPRTKGRGYTLARWWGGWGVNILEDASHRIGLLQ